MRDQGRAIIAAPQLERSAAGTVSPPRCLSHERMQTLADGMIRRLQPSGAIGQAGTAPYDVFGLGIGEKDPALLGDQEDSKAGRRKGRAERIGEHLGAEEEPMDGRRPLQMRREGLKKLPFLGLDPNPVGRSHDRQMPR